MQLKQQAPKFTRLQIEWLERMYPELTALQTHDEMAYRMGQRSVVACLRERLQKDGEQ